MSQVAATPQSTQGPTGSDDEGLPIAPRRRRDRFSRLWRSGLRRRWNVAFALLLVVLLGGGLATYHAVDGMVDSISGRTLAIRERSVLATTLQTKMGVLQDNVHRIIGDPAGPDDTADASAFRDQSSELDDLFHRADAAFTTPATRSLVEESQTLWHQAMVEVEPFVDDDRPRDPRVLGATHDSVGEGLGNARINLGVLIDEVNKESQGSLEAARTLQRRVMVVLAATFGIACLLTVAFARRLSRLVLSPLEVVRAGTERFAAGELDHRIGLSRHDELGMLARAFNEMAEVVAATHQSLAYQAGHDPLTGLANRASFLGRLEQALSQRDDNAVSILFIDLDDFKTVNDIDGHAAGDQLLQHVAERLRSCCRGDDVVARLGGDEFAIALQHGRDAVSAVEMAERVLAALEVPFSVYGKVTQVAASIGVATLDGRSTDDAAEAVRQADIAMYTAKGMGKACFQLFNPALHDEMLDSLSLKADLRGAADRGELVVDYQPVYDLRSSAIVGVEALVRWNHPTRGLLSPGVFVPLAEQTGEIERIDRFVLDTACHQARKWQWERPDHRDLWVSVNVSASHIDGDRLLDDVETVLADSGLPPTSLVLELTETTLVRNLNGDVSARLTALRQRGVRIAIDDFGTGFSSLSYLQRLPVDVLKVDRSFVSGDGSAEHVPLLQTIVALGCNLGLDVVAEGIEEPEQQARLETLGCHYGQGYLLCRPTSPGRITELFDLDGAERDRSSA